MESYTDRSLRYNKGKPDYSLIPLELLEEAARVLEYGASKYERDNWKRPTHWSVSGCSKPAMTDQQG